MSEPPTAGPWFARDGDCYAKDEDGSYVEMIEYGTFYNPADAALAVALVNAHRGFVNVQTEPGETA